MDLSDVKKLLKNQSNENLLKIIVRLSNYSEDAEEWLLDYCKKNSKTEDTALVAKKQIEHYWQIAEEIIDEANMYGGTNQEDDAYDALSKIDELVKDYKLEWEFRKQLVDGMLEQFFQDNSGFEDSLIDSCMTICQTAEEYLYLAERLESSRSHYYKAFAADLYAKYGREDAFIQLQAQNLRYGSDYIRLADYYKTQKQTDKAIQLMEDAVEHADGRMDEVYEWLYREYIKKSQEDLLLRLYDKALKKKTNAETMARLMYQYYSSDYKKKKPYLLKAMELCDSREARKWFDECRNTLTSEDFHRESDAVYSVLKKKSIQDYLQVRIEEGALDEVLKYLREHPSRGNMYYSVDQDHKISCQLTKAFPGEICTLYWNECESLCAMTQKKQYMQAVAVLKEIKRIRKQSGMETEWKTEYNAFLERHRRKSTLIGYIRAEKGI